MQPPPSKIRVVTVRCLKNTGDTFADEATSMQKVGVSSYRGRGLRVDLTYLIVFSANSFIIVRFVVLIFKNFNTFTAFAAKLYKDTP